MSEEDFLHDITQRESEQLSAILENTLNNLNIARSDARRETMHLDLNREIIDSDYRTAITLFEKLKEELTTQSSFNCLTSFVNEKQRMKDELNRASKRATESTQNLAILQDEVAYETTSNHQEAQALNVQLGTLKDQYQNELSEHEVTLRYFTDWLQAQSHQHAIRLQQEEDALTKQIQEVEKNLEMEHCVHDELEDFYSMKLGEYIQQLVYWVEKYEEDKKNYDEKIANMKSEHANMLERIKTAKQQYDSRQAEIAAYEEIKEKRRLEEIHLAHLNVTATKIQAWWKGTMVRCKLGPYKVKKPKKGKGKGKTK